MPFSSIPTSLYDPGEPVKQELWDLTKSNFDDLDLRVSNLETSSSNTKQLTFEVYGRYYNRSLSQLSNVSFHPARFNFNITGARLVSFVSSDSGTLEVDLLHSTNQGTSWSSIFSTKPSIAHPYVAPPITPSTNQVLVSTPFSVSIGDYLRLDITSIQRVIDDAQFQLILDYEEVA